MSRKFEIDEYWWDENFKIYEKSSVEIKDGATILIGCNGSGKSTLINQMKQTLKEFEEIAYVITYDELHEGRSNAMSKFGFYEDFDRLSRNFVSSEGENVSNNFGDFLGTVFKRIEKAAICDKKEFWIFLDGIDSGVSIDMVAQQADLFDLICEDIEKSGMVPYIVIATNQYETIGKNKDRCLDVINLKYVTINSYDEYREMIFK